MNKIPIEITETFQRTIMVDADEVDNAISIVHKQYSDGEFVLDENDFIDVNIDVFPSVQVEQSSCDGDIRKVVDYLWEDEQRHWEESGYPSGHIFNSLRRLKKKGKGDDHHD